MSYRQIVTARQEGKRLAYLAADHEAALIENQTREEARAAQWRAEYSAYKCSMFEHGCICLALGFDEWAAVTHP